MTQGSVVALVSTVLAVPVAIAALTWVEARLPETRRAAGAEQPASPAGR